MTELSSAAQAVFWAFNSKFDWKEDGIPDDQFKAIAAALRAVADQSAPEKQLKDIAYIHESYICGMKDALACIEIIADELEAQ
jgi:hypothetical protein